MAKTIHRLIVLVLLVWVVAYPFVASVVFYPELHVWECEAEKRIGHSLPPAAATTLFLAFMVFVVMLFSSAGSYGERYGDKK